MKLTAKVFLAVAVNAIAAYAQDPSGVQGKIKHVIVVIQENRSTDNLFGSNPAFETGVNISPQAGLPNNCSTYQVALKAQPIYTTFDIGHTYEDFQDMWDGGLVDGAWDEYYQNNSTYKCDGSTSTPLPYAYVDNSNSTNPPNEVNPYFWIAQEWGFANYMFQTNQGPSFPAHQFLFSGTAAPVTDGSSWQSWFSSENPLNNVGSPSGCWASTAELVEQVTSVGSYPYAESYTGWVPNEVTLSGGGAPPAGYPCYHHNSIATLLDGANPPISWKYYTNDKTSVWTAPTAIWDICKPNANNVNAPNTVPGPCQGPDYLNKSVYQEVYSTNPPNSAAQVYLDIQSCALPGVTFVTPDGVWSDHAGSGATTNYAPGPSWVANLINLVGQNPACAGTGETYWNDTVILVTWDDWGGWYDHVKPPQPFLPGVLGYSNGSGQNNVYGFRVPLLVVSGYSVVAGTNPPTHGYVSGAWTSGPQPTSCPGPPYCHDFGSILNFIEYVFGTNGQHLGPISPNYAYADSLVLDTDLNHRFSLSDFFNFRLSQPNPFHAIPVPSQYGTSFFTGYGGPPSPPDLD